MANPQPRPVSSFVISPTEAPGGGVAPDMATRRHLVDPYKRFLFALNIAPAVVGEWLRANGKLPVLQRSRTIVLLADALARQVDKGRMSND